MVRHAAVRKPQARPTTVHAPQRGDACMFCNQRLGASDAGADPYAFKAHLASHEDCATQYTLWKLAITDEWLGD